MSGEKLTPNQVREIEESAAALGAKRLKPIPKVQRRTRKYSMTPTAVKSRIWRAKVKKFCPEHWAVLQARKQKYNAEHRDEINAQQRESYAENRDRDRLETRAYYREHRDAILAQKRDAYRKNPEPKRKWQREYAKRNRERINAAARKRRQEKQQALLSSAVALLGRGCGSAATIPASIGQP